jgi:hypothetical protein
MFGNSVRTYALADEAVFKAGYAKNAMNIQPIGLFWFITHIFVSEPARPTAQS